MFYTNLMFIVALFSNFIFTSQNDPGNFYLSKKCYEGHDFVPISSATRMLIALVYENLVERKKSVKVKFISL